MIGIVLYNVPTWEVSMNPKEAASRCDEARCTSLFRDK